MKQSELFISLQHQSYQEKGVKAQSGLLTEVNVVVQPDTCQTDCFAVSEHMPLEQVSNEARRAEHIGEIEYERQNNLNTMYCSRFYPFAIDAPPSGETKYAGVEFSEFVRAGIADRIQLLVAHVLILQIDHTKLITHQSIQPHRVNQLNRLGIRTYTEYPLPLYYLQMRHNFRRLYPHVILPPVPSLISKQYQEFRNVMQCISIPKATAL